jgi:DNA-binding CsgD family transcriptional regulator
MSGGRRQAYTRPTMARPVSKDRVRADILRLCQTATDPVAFYTEANLLIGKVMPFDLSCWHQLDPSTLLATSHYNEFGMPAPAGWAYNEYQVDDVLKFADLAKATPPAGTLRAATQGHPERSERYRELLTRWGFGDEARVAFVDADTCWGAAVFLRGREHRDFVAGEAAFLAEFSRPIAQALRRSLLAMALAADEGDDAPGLLVLDSAGRIDSLTQAALRWISQLVEVGTDAPEQVPVSVTSVAAATRSDPSVRPGGVARARALTRGGRWLVLHGALLEGTSSGKVAVIIEPARSPEIAPLVVQAYGLSRREREVAELVLQGRSTNEIATALFVSPYTVQDHLKAIFEKVGVRSRREMVSRFFSDHYKPALIASGQLSGH